MAVVLDTTVASFIFSSDTRAAYYAGHLSGEILVLSTQTVGELTRGAKAANWGSKKVLAINEFVSRFVVHPATRPSAEAWATLMDGSKRSGRPLSTQDAWVAATAVELNAPLLTHDGDFNAVSCPGLTIIRYDDSGERVS